MILNNIFVREHINLYDLSSWEISKLYDMFKQYPDATLVLEGYDSHPYISYKRLETDEERDERIRIENDKEVKKRDKAYKKFMKLQNEFGFKTPA